MCRLYSVSYLQMRKQSRQKSRYRTFMMIKSEFKNRYITECSVGIDGDSQRWAKVSPGNFQSLTRRPAFPGPLPHSVSGILGNLWFFFFLHLTSTVRGRPGTFFKDGVDVLAMGWHHPDFLHKLCLHLFKPLGRIEHKTQALIGDSWPLNKALQGILFLFFLTSAK